jgi:hypothetical protein
MMRDLFTDINRALRKDLLEVGTYLLIMKYRLVQLLEVLDSKERSLA